RRPWKTAGSLLLESLEARCLPSVTGWPGLLRPVLDAENNDTLDRSQDLGDLSLVGPGEAAGSIATGDTGAADVDWYRFTLDRPARVTLARLDQAGGSPLVSVLGLYNSEPNNRLLAQDDGAAGTGDAHLERPLAAGTYYVAVSGSGDSAFHPRLAGS